LIKEINSKQQNRKAATWKEESAIRFLIRDDSFTPFSIQTCFRLCLSFKVKKLAQMIKQVAEIKRIPSSFSPFFSNKTDDELFSKQL
jgi:hypothetical protein